MVSTYKKWFENQTFADEFPEVPEVPEYVLGTLSKRPSKTKLSSKIKPKYVVGVPNKGPSIATNPEKSIQKPKLKKKKKTRKSKGQPQLHLRKFPSDIQKAIKNKGTANPDSKLKTRRNIDSIPVPLETLDSPLQKKVLKLREKYLPDRVKQAAQLKASIDKTATYRCPFCGKDIPVLKISDHIDHAHKVQKKIKTVVSKKPSSRNKKVKKGVKNHPSPNVNWKKVDEILDLDEPLDGSKYLGHFKREYGKFGSYPLHDDYDDESDAK